MFVKQRGVFRVLAAFFAGSDLFDVTEQERARRTVRGCLTASHQTSRLMARRF
jgi:hypothetical protein